MVEPDPPGDPHTLDEGHALAKKLFEKHGMAKAGAILSVATACLMMQNPNGDHEKLLSNLSATILKIIREGRLQ